MGIVKLLRFRDLKNAGIVNNRVTLGRMIASRGFPPGRLLGQNTRAWTEVEIETWINSRPVERAPDAIPREQRFAGSARRAAAKSVKVPAKRSPKRHRRVR